MTNFAGYTQDDVKELAIELNDTFDYTDDHEDCAFEDAYFAGYVANNMGFWKEDGTDYDEAVEFVETVMVWNGRWTFV